jgi:hypothetical protein
MNTPLLQQQIISYLPHLKVPELLEVLSLVEALWQRTQPYQPEPLSPSTLAMIDQAIIQAQQGIWGQSFNPDPYRALLAEGEEE